MNPRKPKGEKFSRVVTYLPPRIVARLVKRAKGGSVSAVVAEIVTREVGT